jgi:hypothetical protein
MPKEPKPLWIAQHGSVEKLTEPVAASAIPAFFAGKYVPGGESDLKSVVEIFSTSTEEFGMEDRGIKGTTLDDKAVGKFNELKTRFMTLAAIPAFLLGVVAGAGLLWWLGGCS